MKRRIHLPTLRAGCGLAFILLGAPAAAQVNLGRIDLTVEDTTGSAAQEAGIAGRVTDNTGGMLPRVTVEAQGVELPAGPRVAVTDGNGRYAFDALVPGSYVVTFTLPGFEREEREVARPRGSRPRSTSSCVPAGSSRRSPSR